MAAEGVYSSGGVMHNIFMLLLLLLVLVAAHGETYHAAIKINHQTVCIRCMEIEWSGLSFPLV